MEAVVVGGPLSPTADVGLRLPLTQTPGGRLRVDIAATLVESVNAQTGTSYTLLPGDWGRLVTFSNAAAIAVTLDEASADQPDGWFVDVENLGAGAVTITPTTSTINGRTTLVLMSGEGVRIVSDGTNYSVLTGHLDSPIAIVPNTDSGAASTIGPGVRNVSVAAVANDANDWLVLPSGVAGRKIRGWSVVAHEMRTPATTNATINGQDSDGTKEAAIPATTYWEVDCVATNAWILRAWDELGAPITAIVPD